MNTGHTIPISPHNTNPIIIKNTHFIHTTGSKLRLKSQPFFCTFFAFKPVTFIFIALKYMII